MKKNIPIITYSTEIFNNKDKLVLNHKIKKLIENYNLNLNTLNEIIFTNDMNHFNRNSNAPLFAKYIDNKIYIRDEFVKERNIDYTIHKIHHEFIHVIDRQYLDINTKIHQTYPRNIYDGLAYKIFSEFHANYQASETASFYKNEINDLFFTIKKEIENKKSNKFESINIYLAYIIGYTMYYNRNFIENELDFFNEDELKIVEKMYENLFTTLKISLNKYNEIKDISFYDNIVKALDENDNLLQHLVN